jgi:ATP-dependent DNA helicase RecG
MVEENRGDAVLLELPDERIARALGLVAEENGKLYPTLAGLLIGGKETALRKYLPAHEVAFQVLHGSDVKVNEFRRWPLLRAQEWLMQSIQVRNEEQELMIGSARVGVPRYDPRGMREAINNALIHRDYSHLGATHIQIHDDEVVISNPGGFVLGVTPSNVLVASPHPRNPLLADAFKRIGLVERSGRGVGIIYHGQLQNGRRPPSYDRSTTSMVTIALSIQPADLGFVTFVLQTNRQRDRALQTPELMALWLAWQESPVALVELSNRLQIEKSAAEALLEGLAQVGLVQVSRRSYDLIHKERKSNGDAWQTILALLEKEGQVTRRSVMKALNIGKKQAEYLLKTWVEGGKLILEGKGRSAHYILKLRKNSE